MNFDQFMDILGITEEYQIQPKLMEILLSDRKDFFLDELVKNGFDTKKDELREIFEQELANRKTLKQDYTPDCLCSLISKLCGNGQDEILDVCCGVGSLSLPEMSGNTHFFMEEISDVSISLVLLNMAIRNANADIYKKDVLTREVYTHYKLVSSDRYSTIQVTDTKGDSDKKYSYIISNPPYSLKWDPLNDERFQNYDLAPKSKADYAFVLDILYRLNDTGKAFIILPHGVLFRGLSEGKIRKALINDNVIDCVIGLPENLFFNTAIPTIVLCLKKNRKNKDVLFIGASKHFEKAGKQNVLKEEHIEKILDVYQQRKEIDKFSYLASFEEIQKNDFNLNIPRYVDTFEEKEPIDIKRSLENLIHLENEIQKSEKKLAGYLKDLTGPTEYKGYRDGIVEHLEHKEAHTYSNMLGNIDEFIKQNRMLLMVQKEVHLLDVVTFERSRKGKIYPPGCILIQVSATRGQLEYLKDSSTVDSKFGVFIPKWNVNPKYLYYILEMLMPNFLARYQTGLNINPEIFKHFIINIHTDVDVQALIVKILDSLRFGIESEEKTLNEWKNVKQYHLDNMFV